MDAYLAKNWQYAKKTLMEHVGKEINGITMTYSGMLMGCHLLGYGGMEAYLKTGGKNYPAFQADGNNTHIEEYLTLFADYDVSNITKIPHKNYAWNNYAKRNIKVPKEYPKTAKTPARKFDNKMVDKLENANQKFLEDTKKTKEKYYEALIIEGQCRTKEYKTWLEHNKNYNQIRKNYSPYKIYENKNNYLPKHSTDVTKIDYSKEKTKRNSLPSASDKKLNHIIQTEFNNSNEYTDEQYTAMLEGFDSGELGEGNKSYRNEDDWKRTAAEGWRAKAMSLSTEDPLNARSKGKQFNVGDPNTDKGHWVTMNGTHIFIKDKV